ncbi:MAG: Flp pilus assembly complex ATPase component TadA [Planctomycetales bacterium]|nr:Flp pilus assembly complex ATPase component TadA [Planctomycetales bacterium]
MSVLQSRRKNQDPLDREQLRIARSGFREAGDLHHVASVIGLPSEDELLEAVGSSLQMEVVELRDAEVDLSLLDAFPPRLIHRRRVFPLQQRKEGLQVAVANPFDLETLDLLAGIARQRILPVLARPRDVGALIKKHLGVGAETVDGMLASRGDVEGSLDGEAGDEADLAQQASVVRLVNEILTEAIESRASDVHLESSAEGMQIRYRIDGVLQRQPVPPEIHHFRAAIISRLKIMSQLNIAERRVPQDGRIKLQAAGRDVDVRVSIIPMLHGEGIVMRVLDKDRVDFSLRGLGMAPAIYEQFDKLIKLPHGIILVTGPTGSGKTTTLYSALNDIKSDETKIVTTEDPVEYQLDGIQQIQVHTKVGLTFATSLRSILRHDPDVVLVGEIRDYETAENAIQASLTGHLVFSTLHTNDSAGAFMRLIDMGVEPFLVSSTVEGVMAQRLVRKLCRECRAAIRPQRDDLPEDFPWEELQRQNGAIYRAVGCPACRGAGYRGRGGLYELLVVNDEIRGLAGQRASSVELRKAAIRGGLHTLRDDGWQQVLAGTTTVDEVLRVTRAEPGESPNG